MCGEASVDPSDERCYRRDRGPTTAGRVWPSLSPASSKEKCVEPEIMPGSTRPQMGCESGCLPCRRSCDR
jgi:hypothetical protein